MPIVAVDDTDSRERGMCTTYVGARLAERLESAGGRVRRRLLVRLNPAVKHKTRGNAAVAVHVSGVDAAAAFDLAAEAVREFAADDDPRTSPGLVVADVDVAGDPFASVAPADTPEEAGDASPTPPSRIPDDVADFARRAREDRLTLPAGCFVNYDLAIIELLERIRPRSLAEAYEALKTATGRRPTRTEAYHAGIERSRITRQHGGWWALLAAQGDLTEAEQACLERHRDFLREVETTSMTRSFKMVLLEALLELDGLRQPPTTQAVAEQSRAIFARRPDLAADLNADHQPIQEVDAAQWHRYWLKNPINAWTGGNTGQDGWLRQQEGHLIPAFTVEAEEQEPLQAMIQELVDYQLTVYKARL